MVGPPLQIASRLPSWPCWVMYNANVRDTPRQHTIGDHDFDEYMVLISLLDPICKLRKNRSRYRLRLQSSQLQHPVLSTVLITIYIVVVFFSLNCPLRISGSLVFTSQVISVLLLNLLIAMMGDTYTKVRGGERIRVAK